MMTVAELKNSIKNLSVNRYFFVGEEDYLKRHYLGELRRRVLPDSSLSSFNHVVFEGETVDFASLIDAVSAPAMLAEHKLIEWHNANMNAFKEADFDAFERFMQSHDLAEDCIVVFVFAENGFDLGTVRRPTKLARRAEKLGCIVNFPLSTDTQLLSWMNKHFLKENILCAPNTLRLLLARVGHHMPALASEIDKIICFLKQNSLAEATPEILTRVASHTVESDAFSLTNALSDGRYTDAYTFLLDMKRRRVEPTLVFGQISRLYGEAQSVLLLHQEGLSPLQIAKKLSLHEYKVKLSLATALRLGEKSLAHVLALCQNIDYHLKRGAGDFRGIENLIASLALGAKKS